MEEKIFHFNDREALTIQSDRDCELLYDHFFDSLKQDIPAVFGENFEDLDDVLHRLQLLKETVLIEKWMPKYGCAILVEELDVVSSKITVIGLGAWKNLIHASIKGGREATAVPDLFQPTILDVGAVRKDMFDDLMKGFNLLMQEAQEEGTRQKHHRTPTFVWARILDAMVQLNAISASTVATAKDSYQGGTTDVGLHTSCLPRNTSFPLVASMYSTLLNLDGGDGDHDAFRRTLCVFFLHHLRNISIRVTEFDRRKIDRGIIVIREIERYIFPVKSTKFQDRVVKEIENYHHNLATLKAEIDSEMCTSPLEFASEDLRAAVEPPALPAAPTATTSDVLARLECARNQAEKNLQWSDIMKYTPTRAKIQDVWIVLGRVNKDFWRYARDLRDPEKVHNLEDLKKKMDFHVHATSYALKTKNVCVSIMPVELRSCQMLVIWITFCWAHRVAIHKFPVFKKYSAALDPACLGYLVLQDADAIEAVKDVQMFLKEHRKSKMFPFRDPCHTLDLALSISKVSNDWEKQASAIFESERLAAENKINERYKTIKKSQEKLKALDQQLEEAKATLSSADKDLSRSRGQDYTVHRKKKRYTESYYEYSRARDKASERVEGLKSKISSLEKRPRDVFLPLPQKKEDALRWLFVLFMPKEFVDVLSVAHLAETQLWGTAPPKPSSPEQDLSSWFGTFKTGANEPFSLDGKMVLGSTSRRANSPLTQIDIRQYGRETGVFSPDSYGLLPSWSETDPFSSARKDEDTARYFTEDLPANSSATLQSFLVLLPNKKRGNIGIATKNAKPEWLSYEEYQTFATLRAFPNLQLRQLFVAIHDDLLPFGDERVHVMVRQLLYHVGNSSNWKTDLESVLFCNQIAKQLGEVAALLKESPNNMSKLLLFGTMSSFFGQYNDRCLDCSREYMAISLALGDHVGNEIRQEDTISPRLFWKQAQLYGCALLSHSPKNQSGETLLHLIELIVLFQYTALFATEYVLNSHLQHAVHFAMARNINAILEALEDQWDHLSKYVGLIIDDLPDELNWTEVRYPGVEATACFEAVADDHHYSINILNGVVLVDGVPPGFLPASVVTNPLYERTFGPMNFECIVLGVGHFKTSRLVNDRFLYEFVHQEDRLDIIEFDVMGGNTGDKEHDQERASTPTTDQPNASIHCRGSWVRLQLVPGDRFDLPTLLKEPYSHWYSAQYDAYIVRAPSYKERMVLFVARRQGIYQVPVGDRILPLNRIIETLDRYDRLVFLESRILRGLCRIEDSAFILPWVDFSFTSIRYSMPRLRLEFVQKQDVVHSTNFSGFFLKPQQTLDGVLPGVTTYLVLVNDLDNEKVLIPSGVVAECGNVHGVLNWDDEYSCHSYDIHPRFRHLVAKDTMGRLHLACMYAATACLVAERPSMKTGTEIAIELVRHCWMNQELSEVEKNKLIEVSKLSNLSCTLRLMCTWIWSCSSRLGFLRDYHVAEEIEHRVATPPNLDMDPLALREYRENQHAPRLLPAEELSLLGIRRRDIGRHLSMLASPRKNETQCFVATQETLLKDKCLVSTGCTRETPLFPLDFHGNTSVVERTFYEELALSWDDHCSLPTFKVSIDSTFCLRIQDEVKNRRVMIENAILESLKKHKSIEFRIAILSGNTRLACPYDLLRLAVDECVFEDINPFLSIDRRMRLRIQIIEWMMLCVLEDKLSRINTSSSSNEIMEELRSVRTWNPWKHVPWLAFEVEQRLQIRPYQYAVVSQLMENPNSTIQLNMGLGKTSVLVPMLLLEKINSGTDVVRINMLPSIISVVEQMYKSSLTASVHHVRIMTLPFQRNFPLDETHSKLISEELARSKAGKCCVLVTPQHRNSLLLKQYDEGIFVEGIKRSSFDVIDECDAVLHQSFQLVYALGDQEHLPDGHSRWTIIEAFLQILAESSCPQVSSLRNDPLVVHKEGCSPGKFPGLRLLPGFKAQQDILGKALCRALIENPPHDLLWMKRVNGVRRDLLIDIMSNDQFLARETIDSDPVFRDFKADILSARGCIAFGLLFHCLLARHRVQYGIDTSRGRLAVPFSASDTPKARSDYSHPDVQIVYTCLSYFHCGITKEQLKQALACLQKLGPTAQETIYDSWIESIRFGPTNDEHIAKFDSIRKIDTDNSEQINLMHESLGSCMQVISFWMNNFVFPQGTHVFPQRRVTSAWELVSENDEHNSVGFSGTDDNRSLLPLSIKQVEHQVPELRATNGAMIDRILKRTTDIHLLIDNGADLWKNVLQKCAETHVHALIDVGGLMAGTNNADAAVFLSKSVDQPRFRGVVYFDTTSNAWNVLAFKSKQHTPLQTSSLVAGECFVFYDESRCRGSDLVLPAKASALVTVEAGLTKDKFLQGCARMRKLRPNEQSLQLAGTNETLNEASTVEDVLKLTIKNSAEAIEKGIMELYDRGVNHFNFPEPQGIDVSLLSLYGGAVKKFQSMGSFLDATIDQDRALSEDMNTLVEYCRAIGDNANVKGSQLSEECERELEEEEQEEKEEENEVETLPPALEKDWDFESAFSDGPIKTKVFMVKRVINLGIQWSEKLQCTSNFLTTVAKTDSQRFYLRPVNAFLHYSDGRIVLVSDYEADKLLPHWWNVQHTSPPVKFGHLSLACSKIWLGGDERRLPTMVRTSAKLFRGYVSFKKNEQRALNTLFIDDHPRKSILKLLKLRHRLRFLDRSDLDTFSLLAAGDESDSDDD